MKDVEKNYIASCDQIDDLNEQLRFYKIRFKKYKISVREKEIEKLDEKNLLFLVVIIVTGYQFVHSWGALIPARHHQYIVKMAYEKQKLDPAFKGKNRDIFPTLKNVLAHEGVSWVSNSWRTGHLRFVTRYAV